MKRLAIRVAIAAAVVLVLAAVLLVVFRTRITNAMLFYPERGQSRTPEDLGMPYDEVWVEASDGVRTQGWWIPGQDAAPVVIMFHGNAGTIADRLENAQRLRELGVSIYMAEYRGYGESEGKPSEAGLYADSRAVLAEARRRSAGQAVVIFGRSLGGAVAIDLASHERVEGLVAESTFTSLPAMASTTGIPFAARLVAYDFLSIDKIQSVTAPVLVIHGDADELIPLTMGKSLHAAAAKAPRADFHRVAGGTHNDTWHVGGTGYWDAWRRFLDRVQPAPDSTGLP